MGVVWVKRGGRVGRFFGGLLGSQRGEDVGLYFLSCLFLLCFAFPEGLG